jgi:hypothetical protein
VKNALHWCGLVVLFLSTLSASCWACVTVMGPELGFLVGWSAWWLTMNKITTGSIYGTEPRRY